MQTSKTKGNPASKRMSNKSLAERRARSWRAGQERKAGRRKAQERREAANRTRRANGEPTPWEWAKAVRAGRRAEANA